MTVQGQLPAFTIAANPTAATALPIPTALSSSFSMAGGSFDLAIPPRGASINLNGTNESWIPPNPNVYHLFVGGAVLYNQRGLFVANTHTTAAFAPPNGSNLIHLVAQTWITAGAAASGSIVAKWYKNATVDANSNLLTGIQLVTGIGAPADQPNTWIMRADGYDQPSNGDYYNLFMFVDSTSLGVTTVSLDGNPAHTFVQATVLY